MFISSIENLGKTGRKIVFCHINNSLMRSLIVFTFLFWSMISYGQFHDYNISKITELKEAREYASRYREVSYGIVNMHKDPFLFDAVDTSNLEGEIGRVVFIFNRGTKFLRDTLLEMVHIQVVEFNTDLVPSDSISSWKQSVGDMLSGGSSYWDVKKRFLNSGITFKSEPIDGHEIMKQYGLEALEIDNKKFHKFQVPKNSKIDGWIVIDESPVYVPAFYSISYLRAG
jgi:hypothetical protein